jgi:hypothetical protein
VDLVVGLVIVVTVAGLVLVLILRARESSDRLQCAANLKRLGEAVHGVHEQKRFLPPSRIAPRHATWAVLLSPYLSAQSPDPLKDWDLRKPYTAQEEQARQAQLVVFYCPARHRFPQLGPGADQLLGALGDYACVSGNGDKAHPWDGPDANGPIILGISKLDPRGDLVLEWRGRVTLADLGDNKSYKLLLGDKHVPLGQYGQAAAGDGPLYDGTDPRNAARVAGFGHGIAASPPDPFRLNFGSSHEGAVCQFIKADVSLQVFTPDVAEAVLSRMADRHAPPEK